MRGTILGVHDGRGVLLGPSDERLEFPLSEWRSAGVPAPGQLVDFVEEGGSARAVFAVPNAPAPQAHSRAAVMSYIAVGCLALGFVVPLIPTVLAFVLGLIGAGQARASGEETPLLLSRIAWIGALVWLAIGLLALLAVFAFLGTVGAAAIWHGLGPID
jgi:hypothetical protein